MPPSATPCAATSPSRHPAPGRSKRKEEKVSDADLGIPLGDAPVPARPGQPCPGGIGAIKLTVAETARLTRLARQHLAKHGRKGGD